LGGGLRRGPHRRDLLNRVFYQADKIDVTGKNRGKKKRMRGGVRQGKITISGQNSAVGVLREVEKNLTDSSKGGAGRGLQGRFECATCKVLFNAP